MSKNSNKNLEDQEIDLAIISKKISGFFLKINASIFKSIQFFIKKSKIILVLIFIGFGLGLYLDKSNKIYDHKIIVQPNFESTDYLYSKIELLGSKIKEKDTAFFKAIGINDSDRLLNIKIMPVIDIYKFIESGGAQNFELFKLMAEDGDIKTILEERATSKNYTYHQISFSTKSLTSTKKTIIPILNYLNKSDFYTKIQKESIYNVNAKIKANDIVSKQIDGFLDGFTSKINNSTKSEKLIYYNENTQLNDAIETKIRLINEQGNLRIYLVSLDKIIKDSSSTINVENTKLINGKMKLVLPLLLIFIFILIHFFIGFYKKQQKIFKNKELE